MSFSLFELARRREFAELTRRLELATRETHATSTRGAPLSEIQKLLDEALWYAQAGDFEEAVYRLEQTRN